MKHFEFARQFSQLGHATLNLSPTFHTLLPAIENTVNERVEKLEKIKDTGSLPEKYSDCYETDRKRYDCLFGESKKELFDQCLQLLGQDFVDQLHDMFNSDTLHLTFGCLVSFEGALPTPWHRDVYPIWDRDDDWRLIPPYKPVYLSILIPLQPMNEKVGMTEVIEGSAGADQSEFINQYPDADYVKGDLKEGIKTHGCKLEVGEALVFNGFTIHRAAPNLGGVRRVLYLSVFKPFYNSLTFDMSSPSLFGEPGKMWKIHRQPQQSAK